MIKHFAVFIFLLAAGESAFSQIQAKAISYSLEVDMKGLDPSFDESDGGQRLYKFEVDTYYNERMLRTIVRKVGTHSEPGLTIRQRLYDLNSHDQMDIDHDQQFILSKKDQRVDLKKTGNVRDILGYKCREYVFTDYRGVRVNVWVADKTQRNVCPLGNFTLPGTALEVVTSNGLHYTATDFSEGLLDNDFFDPPKGYQEEVVVASTAGKKSK